MKNQVQAPKSTPAASQPAPSAFAGRIQPGTTEVWSPGTAPIGKPEFSQLGGTVEAWEDGMSAGEPNQAADVLSKLRASGETNTPASDSEIKWDDGSMSTTPPVEFNPELNEPKRPRADDDTNVNAQEAAQDAPQATDEVKPTRRDLLKNIDAEKRARRLEAQLKVEQEKVRQFTSANVSDLMAARGLTKEQAVTAILDSGVSVPAFDPNPEFTAMRQEMAELRRERTEATNRTAAQVITERLQDIEVPTFKAWSRAIPIPQGDGTAIMQPKNEVLAQLCHQMWVEDGSPGDKPVADYIVDAAQTLDAALNEEYGDIIAVAKTRAAPAQVASQERRSIPSVGKRTAVTTASRQSREFDGMDDDARHRAIKAKFGLG